MYSTARRRVSTLDSFLEAPLPCEALCGDKAWATLAGMCDLKVANPLFTCFTRFLSRAFLLATEAGCWVGAPYGTNWIFLLQRKSLLFCTKTVDLSGAGAKGLLPEMTVFCCGADTITQFCWGCITLYILFCCPRVMVCIARAMETRAVADKEYEARFRIEGYRRYDSNGRWWSSLYAAPGTPTTKGHNGGGCIACRVGTHVRRFPSGDAGEWHWAGSCAGRSMGNGLAIRAPHSLALDLGRLQFRARRPRDLSPHTVHRASCIPRQSTC